MAETKYKNFEIMIMDIESLKKELKKELKSEQPDENYIEEIITYGAWGDAFELLNQEEHILAKAFKLVVSTPEEATNLFLKEIREARYSWEEMEKEPDIEFMKNILAYSVIDINADSNYSGLPYGCKNPTPLIAAVDMNIIEIVQMILNAGANPNGQNRFGATAIWSASFLDNVEAVRELLKHPEINPNIMLHDKSVETPTALGVAARRRNIDIVEEILKHPKTDVNIRYSESSWTPLMEAACEKDIHIIKMLLNHLEIDVTLKDWEGRTAWDIAGDKICELLPQLNPNS